VEIQEQVIIHNLSRPLPQPIIARYCASFFCRLRGLTFRRQIPIHWGLLLVQKRDSRVDASIHMLGVWTDLAVIWINSAEEVVDIKLARRWRLAYLPERPARYVLELAPAHLKLKASQIRNLLFGLILALALSLSVKVGYAQETSADGPIYIVQEGDTLWSIALRFRVSVEDLARVNGINDANQLTLGARLVIPGLEGIQGILTTQTVQYGENLHSLSRRYQVPEDTLIQLNHLTAPSELYAGVTLVIPEQENQTFNTQRMLVSPDQSLFELAISQGNTPWKYCLSNDLPATWSAIPGDVLHISAESSTSQSMDEPGALPQAIYQVELSPSPYVQGKVAVVRISGEPGLSFEGVLDEHVLHFFPEGQGQYVSLQGIHAMAEPGLYPLSIHGTLPEGSPYYGAPFSFSQAVLVKSGNYYFDPVLVVPPETIDPAVTKPEDAQWAALAAPITPEKYWEGIFQSPAPEPFSDCWPSLFGNRRSYNGSPYEYFHTGLDFCGGVGTQIMAPARGVVVFAGPLTVRGNATMIDHGWGVFSGYMHQSEIKVNEGDLVEPGQVIGLVGGTGRVTGPHLHWEMWVGGVQVDPLDWLNIAFPGE
jgi:murein DD-endopeptidase MepM/ murein hydrolase activator NlpD/uncharacterized membrane protein (UPF0127 family)